MPLLAAEIKARKEEAKRYQIRRAQLKDPYKTVKALFAGEEDRYNRLMDLFKDKELGEAKEKVENLTRLIDEHLIKLVMFGDRKGWRDELIAWCVQIQAIRVNLPSRKRLTKDEYLNCMDEFDYPDNRTTFYNIVERVERNMNPKMSFIRGLDEGMGKVHYLQIRIAELCARNEFTKEKFDSILRITL